MKKILLSLAVLALGATFASAEEVAYTFSEHGYANAEDITTVSVNDNITFTFAKGSNSNGTKYYNSGAAARFYAGNILTVTATGGYNLDKVEFALANTSDVFGEGTTVSVGTFANNVWTAPAEPTTEFTLTNGGAKGHAKITTITVTYSIAGNPDKQSPELSFGDIFTYTVDIDEAADFVAPTLLNPNNLAVTYSSSNEDVATVDATGAVTILAKGTTVIKATSAETDTYNAGEASYTIEVIGTCKSIAELMALGSKEGVVGFEMVVTYVNGINCYVKDRNSDNVILIYGNTTYEAGDVIPKGWSCTYSPYNGLPEIKPVGSMPASAENIGFTPEEVDAVNMDMVNQIVVLKNVKFAEATPETKTNFDGVVGETAYTFRNNFTIGSVEAGDYDVTLAVARYNTTLQLYPISYKKVDIEAAVSEIEVADGEALYYNMQGVRVAEPENGLYIRVANGKAVKVIVK